MSLLTAHIVINDFRHDTHEIIQSSLLIGPEEFSRVIEKWEAEDRVLVDLQREPAFKGCTRFCDLLTSHYRVLLRVCINKVMELPEEDRDDHQNTLLISLHNLFAALIHHIQESSGLVVENVRVSRYDPDTMSYDISSSMEFTHDFPKRVNTFRIVVDNTSA